MKKGLIIGIIVVLILAVGGFFLFNNSNSFKKYEGSGEISDFQENVREDQFQKTSLDIPSCEGRKDLFTETPINFDDLWYIRPLGFIGEAPEHIYPTDHVYLYTYRTEEDAPIERAFYSPGDMWITEIIEDDMAKPVPNSKDYSLHFSPCKEVEGFFLHLSTVSDKLKLEIKPPYERCEDYEFGRFKGHTCTKKLSIKVSAGEQLGTMGKLFWQRPLDFSLSDYREKELDYANTSRWQKWQRYLVCPLDYFNADLKIQLKSLLGEREDRRTTNPICGEVNQDIKGTAQGTWFVKNSKSKFIRPELSLMHDFQNSTIGAMAIGFLETLEPAVYYFTPTNSGLVNRDFKDIKDENIYCFDNLLDQKSTDLHKKPSPISILVQLTSPTTLKVGENIEPNCGEGSWAFKSFEELER
ncbi:MAG: hypothetical protein KJI72_00675 [Patescibacteria group bacterium]|nr:hypothetical protein [Patescibacteria group bacterium]